MPNENEVGWVDRFLRSWAGKITLAVIFGPIALVYLFGFLFGQAPKMGQFFGAWFMASMTMMGLVATLDEASGIWTKKKRVELGCLLPVAIFTCWMGYVFLKEAGFLK